MGYERAIYIQASNYDNINKTELVNAGITDIYIRALHTSTPGYSTVLPYVLNQFSDTDIKIHAWVGCFNEGGTWHYPNDSDWKTFIKGKIADIVANYNIVGVVLDYCRWSGVSGHISGEQSPNGAIALTEFVGDCAEIVHTENPNLKVIVSLSPETQTYGSTYAADYYYGQRYDEIGDLVDEMAPMAYTGNFYKYPDHPEWIGQVVDFIQGKTECSVIPIIQNHRSDSDTTPKTVNELNLECQSGIDAGSTGFGLFRYGMSTNYPSIMDPTEADPTVHETEWKTPTTGTNSGSGVTWVPWAGLGTLPEGMQVRSDGKAPYVPIGQASSKGLVANGFSFNIPSNATILGVEAIIRVKHGSISINSKVTQLNLYTTSGVVGDNRYSASQPTLTNSYQDLLQGDDDDLWNATLTPAIVNSADFGVYIVVQNLSSTTGNIFVDQVQLKIHYSTSGIGGNDSITPILTTTVLPDITELVLYNELEPVKVVVLDYAENIIGFLDLSDIKVKLTESLEGESTLELEKPLRSVE